MRELIYMPRWLNSPLYPGGLPFHFHNEGWGGNVVEDLRGAIKKYYFFSTEGEPELSEYEQQLLFEYIVYHINAPIWDLNEGFIEGLQNLRALADKISTLDELDDYIDTAMNYGLDPL